VRCASGQHIYPAIAPVSRYMSERYAEQQETAVDRLDGSVAFSVLSKYPSGTSNFTYGIDADDSPSEKEATVQLLVLLGHHIRHLAGLLEVDESRVIELAMEAIVGFEAD
jgi:hypothetical protein